MAKLRTISIDELDHLQQDEHGNLYWKGTKLTDIRTFAFLIAAAAVVGAATSIVIMVIEIGRAAAWWV